MASERRITSVALTEAQLARAHASQDTLAAFIVIIDETALAAARQADADFAAGIDKGPLQGIPIGIKDIIATKDAPTTANSRVLDPAWGQRDDATVVKKLRDGRRHHHRQARPARVRARLARPGHRLPHSQEPVGSARARPAARAPAPARPSAAA